VLVFSCVDANSAQIITQAATKGVLAKSTDSKDNASTTPKKQSKKATVITDHFDESVTHVILGSYSHLSILLLLN
jgi:hypothetical protein